LQITPELLIDLQATMSLSRLSKTGLFQKLDLESSDGIENELTLHRAVLDKALIDSFSIRKEIREDVENWLHLDNPDFLEACERAMLDPQLVFEMFKLMKEVLKGDRAKFRKFKERG
jgi:hypothetical protein